MPWQIIVFLRACTYFIGPAMQKKLTGLPGRPQRLVAQFAFAGLLALVYYIISRGWTASVPLATVSIVFLIGCVNALGAYAHWRSVDISLSQTSLFSQADDLIALLLGMAILGETHYLRPLLTVGVLLCLGGALAYTLMKKDGQMGGRLEKRRFVHMLVWVLIYSTIWGGAVFSFRYFALAGVPIALYVLAWYGGSFFGSWIVLGLVSPAERGTRISLPSVLRVFPLAALVWGSLMLAYWANEKAPIVRMQPIYQVAEMIFPTLVGLYFFKEGEALTFGKKMLFALGCGGVVLLFFA